VSIYNGDCHDPQCGDSTWDHECPLPPGNYEVVNGVTLSRDRPIPQYVKDLGVGTNLGGCFECARDPLHPCERHR
jgi:hypothetical protein